MPRIRQREQKRSLKRKLKFDVIEVVNSKLQPRVEQFEFKQRYPGDVKKRLFPYFFFIYIIWEDTDAWLLSVGTNPIVVNKVASSTS